MSVLKKSILILPVIALFVISGVLLSACGNSPVVSATPRDGTFQTNWQQGTTPTFDEIRVVIRHENGREHEVGRSALTIATITDMVTLGPRTVNASYGAFTFTFQITVIEQAVASDMRVTRFALPSALLQYQEENRWGDGTQEGSFIRRNEAFYVGYSNHFNFFPVVMARPMADITGEGIIIHNFESAIEIAERLGNAHTILTGSALSAVVSYDANIGRFQFTPAAANRTFRIRQTPNDARFNTALVDDVVLSFEVTVIDGINVYTIEELALFHSEGVLPGLNLSTMHDTWFSWRRDRRISINPLDVNALILMNDIVLNPDDLPRQFFNENGTGELLTIDGNFSFGFTDDGGWVLDSEGNVVWNSEIQVFNPGSHGNAGRGLFVRQHQAGQEFNFIGNYFTISAQDMPKADIGNRTGPDVLDAVVDLFVITHPNPMFDDMQGNPLYPPELATQKEIVASLLGQTLDFTNLADSYFAKANIKNMRILGNTTHGHGAGVADMFGGLSLLRNNHARSDLEITNVIATSFATFGEFRRQNDINITDSKFFDAFSLAFRFDNSGARDGRHPTFINTEVRRGGGPLIYIISRERSGGGSFVQSQVYTGTSLALTAEHLLDPNNFQEVFAESFVFVCEDSVFENFVTGTEPWFNQMGAGVLVTGIVIADANVRTISTALENPATITQVRPTPTGTAPMINLVAAVAGSGNPLSANYTPFGGVIRFGADKNDIIHRSDSMHPIVQFNSAQLNLFNGNTHLGAPTAGMFDGNFMNVALANGSGGNLMALVEMFRQ